MRCVLLATLTVSLAAFARQAPEAEAQAQEEESAPALPEFNFQRGTVVLPGGMARLEVPEDFGYLDPTQAHTFITQVWGNPPGHGEDTLGMLVPTDIPLDSPESWGVVITYLEDGHVSDEDAADIDYADLLEEMQGDTREESKEREAAGYGKVALVGWAAPPHYDASTRKLHWAQELDFGGDHRTLNYNIRALGKEGVLVLNAVSNMDQLTQVEGGMKDVLAFTHFQPGHTYEDFDPKTGRLAAYGIGGLVAGKLAAKAGFFKLLAVFFAKFAKVILFALVALGAAVSKLLKSRGASTQTGADTSSGTPG